MLSEHTQREILELLTKNGITPRPLKMFAINSSIAYAQRIAKCLEKTVTPTLEKFFPDGEAYVAPVSTSQGNVRGHDTFIVASLFSDENESVNDKLIKVCILAGSLKHSGAKTIRAFIPHMPYARQDCKDRSRAPLGLKTVVSMLQSSGVDHIVSMDVHNLAAIQNAADVPIDNLEARMLHAVWTKQQMVPNMPLAVVTPDAGGLKRVRRFRSAIAKVLGIKEDDIEIGIYDKYRDVESGEVTGGQIVGKVTDHQVVIVDDLISTGSTIKQAADAVLQYGGRLIGVCATHGLFVGNAQEIMNGIPCPIAIADTIPPFRLSDESRKKTHVIDTSELMASAVHRIYAGTGSISDLLEDIPLGYQLV